MPITFIAIAGVIIGAINGTLGENFNFSAIDTSLIEKPDGISTGLFPAICGTIFAYEGWIVATSINSEIRDSKKNLPIALCVGSLIIVLAYTLYNIGILGLADIVDVSNNGNMGAFINLDSIFKGIASVVNVLIVISCLGTLNGLMLGCCRGFYSLSVRGEGVAPSTLRQIDPKTDMPQNASIFVLLTCALWFAYFIIAGGNFANPDVQGDVWLKINEYAFDSSELPIITVYPLYVPILIIMMIREKNLTPLKRFVLPSLSIAGICVIVAASILKHKMDNVWYLILFGVIMGIGALVRRRNIKHGDLVE